MDFFREQDIARRNSRLLTALFCVAVLLLIVLTNLLLAGFLIVNDTGTAAGHNDTLFGRLGRVDWRMFFGVGGAISFVIAVVVLFNWLRFAQGGKAVAEALGGRPAASASTDPWERRAQNIVQEIALAANMPVPPLYILDQERGINAFAAGVSPANAVVAVTRGALEQLTRDELQGVIGHEFSHILNGDMRLSIRLAAMLRGITFIGDVGSLILRSAARSGRRRRSNSKNDNAAVALIIGLGLYLIGLLGGVMAGIIKSAISKQKEYLADASAVQFTRNPDGIGNALKVIGGYTPGTLVHTARAEELSHLFFGQVKHRLWTLFATHPPLAERIRRIDPHWDGQFIERDTRRTPIEPQLAQESGARQFTRTLAAVGLADIEFTGNTDARPAAIEPLHPAPSPSPSLAVAVIEEAREPLGAMTLVLALLWHRHQGDEQNQQLAAVRKAGITGLEALVAQRGPELADLSPALRLALIELCLPTLKTLSVQQYQQLKQLLLNFIRADGHIDLFEWCLFQLLRHYLDPQFSRVKPSKPRYKALTEVAADIGIVLGTLAALGNDDTEAAFLRGVEMLDIDLPVPAAKSPDIGQFSQSVARLADCYPLLKVPVLKAMAAVSRYDGEICARELTVLKAIAAVIDCPLPNSVLNTITD